MLRRTAFKVGSLLFLFLAGTSGIAHAVALELGPPELIEAFDDSLHVLVYPLPSALATQAAGLVAGRARLEVTRTDEAPPQVYSAAISCILEDANWELVLLSAIAMERVVGPGVSYFQVTGNLVEYAGACGGEAEMVALIWGPITQVAAAPEASVTSVRLLYDD